jgi:hypothetical protein
MRTTDFSNLILTIEQNVSMGEFSVNRYRMQGSDATGRRFTISGMDMVRVVEELVMEHWAYIDTRPMRAKT